METDQDGLYSLAQMRTEYADLTEAQYDAIDANTDAAIDAEEMAAAIKSDTLPPID